MKEIEDTINPKEFDDFKRKISFEKRKSNSFRIMMNKKVILINKKISYLNEMGHKIEPLDIST